MARNGTDAYDTEEHLPRLVARAVELARAKGFAHSCLPSHGRLLGVLAGGVGSGVIAETGTGAGVGLAWMASAARPGVRLVSVERDAALVAATRELFADVPAVEVVLGDWSVLAARRPFALLALDGGGQGKAGEPPCEPGEWLEEGGVVVMDDFAPATGWPPLYDGLPDAARLYWLQHHDLLATEVRTAPAAASIIGVLRSGVLRAR